MNETKSRRRRDISASAMTTQDVADAAVLRRPLVRPSISAVAQRAGVSIATVSRIMNGIPNRASADTIRRVQDAIRELKYRPSSAGSSLRRGKSRTVALLAPDPANAYHASIAAAVERELRVRQKVMILCGTGEDPALQDDFLFEMRAQSVCGIVLVAATQSPVLSTFVREGEPVVFLNRRCPDRAPTPFIGIDDFQAGRDVATHFIHRGYVPAAIVHGPLTSTATRDRVRGFRARWTEADLQLDDRYVLARPTHANAIETSYSLADRLLKLNPRPRAIFCTTDESAFGVYRRCRELGLQVPEDIALWGFDGSPLNAYLAPWLSTVSVPTEQFGPAVAQLLDRIWAGEDISLDQEILLPYTLKKAD